ncbi:glycoside hydrolase [Saitoella complicata NRRL Y-17804]|uniref:glycoside hydrolase n=1 Tax=Saitoella complicata (strain BCRC 22490 / CBS 7301 / JCM 7358 / NBRC 10748 / NRRL Y-17804) TaxID=698492 RepID=UPI000866EC86|nr:glycoside hydrolase [Saitoella complicata NRRL Y-17804]ODQ54682.1 glycoside hydrolase [Saitoella complicata NRRL Y-17804]
MRLRDCKENGNVAFFLLALIAFVCFNCDVVRGMTRERRLQLRDEARSDFFHGFDGYMTHAFPADELNPITCSPRGRNLRDPNDLGVNDVCGGFSLTLIDSLPTLALMNRTRFEEGVRGVLDSLGEEGFDLDVRVQVFEVTIRVLGGLLSAHQEAQGLDWYNNELLHLAHDLGTRLLPAFETPTGIPWPRINLRNGLALHPSEKERSTNNAAGAGSLILEFTLLSRLTGDERFESVARRAFFAVWDRRIRTRRGSGLGVVGNEIDAWTGEWGSYITGLGAGVDSFYEYAVKAHILTGDEAYLRVWDESYAALRLYSADSGGWVWKNFHVVHGWVATFWIDSLAAYFPGLLTLVGEVKAAEKMWLVYWGLLRRYAAIPERWDWRRREVEVQVGHYPLRPEFVESTYHLWRATGDEYYLSVGEVIMRDLERRCKTRCGWAGLQRVEDNIAGGKGREANWQDRMESFALSETWKYLFLMFDEKNPLHKGDAPDITSTFPLTFDK